MEVLERRALLSGDSAQLVKEINPVDVYPAELTPADTNLFYVVKDSYGTGIDLAVTTTGGSTTILKDFVPGVASSSAASTSSPPTGPIDLTAAGSSVYFLASDGTSQDVLWTSNGTAAGTEVVPFLDPYDPGSTDVTQIVDSYGLVYFTTTDPSRQPGSTNAYGDDLWSITAGSATANLVSPDLSLNGVYPPGSAANLTPAFGLLFPSYAAVFGVVFTVGGELWASKGNSAAPLTYENTTTLTQTTIENVTSIGLFSDVDVFYQQTGSNTLDLATINFGSTAITLDGAPNALYTFSASEDGYGTAATFTDTGNDEIFTLDGSSGESLWATNGTESGTQEILSGYYDTFSNLTDDAGTLYFTTTNDIDF